MAKNAYTESVKACWQEFRTPGNVRYRNDLPAVFKIAHRMGEAKEEVAASVAERLINTRVSAQAPLSAADLPPGSTMPPPRYMPAGITSRFAMGGDKIAGNIERVSTSGAARAGSGDRTDVDRVTGYAWGAYSAVKGMNCTFVAGRNARKRKQKTEAFARTTVFRAGAFYEKSAPPHVGMVYSAETGARLTLCGGARG